jgi:molybdopterin synthase sulfur carrier subunit
MVKVLLFGKLRDVAGWRERACEPAPPTLSALRAMICADDPALADALAAPGVQAAIDRVLAREDAVLDPGSEVAFMPAMSGG